MSTTDRKIATLSDAPAVTHRKHHLGLAAAGAVMIAGLGTGLTALIIGVTANTDTEAPDTGVPTSVFDPGDPTEMTGIDNRLYQLKQQLAEQRRQAER